MTAVEETMRGKELVIVRGRDFFNHAVNIRCSHNILIVIQQGEHHNVPDLIRS
jgi:hypothetical protein